MRVSRLDSGRVRNAPLDGQELEVPALLCHHPVVIRDVVELNPSIGEYSHGSCMQQHGARFERAHIVTLRGARRGK